MAKETSLHHDLADIQAERFQGTPGAAAHTLPGMGQPAGDEETVDVLNELSEALRDGDYGFTTAAGYTDSSHLKALLARRASECREAAQELQSLIGRLGGEATEGGSATGALHRGWVSVRGTVSHYSDEAMLQECERGEEAAMAAFVKALTSNLPPGIRNLVERQSQSVRRSQGEVQAMRDSLS